MKGSTIMERKYNVFEREEIEHQAKVQVLGCFSEYANKLTEGEIHALAYMVSDCICGDMIAGHTLVEPMKEYKEVLSWLQFSSRISPATYKNLKELATKDVQNIIIEQALKIIEMKKAKA